MSRASGKAQPVISGAGLAGAMMAVFMARRGFDVQVCERNPDLRRVAAPAGRSINLALAERGIHALRKAGVFAQVEALLVPMRGRMLHDRDGSLKLQPYSRNPDEVVYSVSRAGLTAVLLNAAEQTGRVRFLFGHSVVEVEAEAGKLQLQRLADHEQLQVTGAPLIAADGAGSVIRRAMHRDNIIEASEQLLSHGYKELTIPPAVDGSFRMDPNALHIWPRGGFMLIALPNPDASFTVTLFMAERGRPGFAELDSADKVRAFFAREFPDTLPLIPDLESAFLKNPVGVLGTVRCQPWNAGANALLIGDAAHAIVPFHGQGMNCAFEDCAVLDNLLEEDAGDWLTVFDRFSSQRKADADAIAEMALDNYVEMRDTVRDPKFHLRKALAWELEARFEDRFVPRYSMVMFRRIPYALARSRGALQAELLETLTSDAETLQDVDMARAARMVKDSLPPIDRSLLVG